MSTHVEEFETMLKYLSDAGVHYNEYIQSIILLLTLPDNSSGLDSWMGFISSLLIDKDMKLSAMISVTFKEVWIWKVKDLSEEKEITLATGEHQAKCYGKKFCCNCDREGNETADCWAKGGAKESEWQKQKCSKKKKEKAKAAKESDSLW